MTDIQGFVACDHETRPMDDDTIRRMHSALSRREETGMGQVAEAIFDLLCLFRWRDIYNLESCCLNCRWRTEVLWDVFESTRRRNGMETVEFRQTMLGITCHGNREFILLERCGRHEPATG